MSLFDNQVLSVLRHGGFRDFLQLLSACQPSYQKLKHPRFEKSGYCRNTSQKLPPNPERRIKTIFGQFRNRHARSRGIKSPNFKVCVEFVFLHASLQQDFSPQSDNPQRSRPNSACQWRHYSHSFRYADQRPFRATDDLPNLIYRGFKLLIFYSGPALAAGTLPFFCSVHPLVPSVEA